MGHSFREIEHKFVVDSGFDRAAFFSRLNLLHPVRTNTIKVEDTYYVLKSHPGFIYRHRFDSEIQQLTAKSLGRDPEVRTEINLDLICSPAGQGTAVSAFLETFGVTWKQTIQKDIAVAYFNDCEIVHYRASSGTHSIECVEFEAVGEMPVEKALKIITDYELKAGFNGFRREERTLFELLLLVNAPRDVVNLFAKGGSYGT